MDREAQSACELTDPQGLPLSSEATPRSPYDPCSGKILGEGVGKRWDTDQRVSYELGK